MKKKTREMIEMPIGDLIPYEKNAKRHDEEQVEQIANSIKRFGFVQPVVIDRDNVIVIGHGRVLGAKKAGLETVPCLRAEDLNKKEIKALRLADNKLNESPWDFDLLNGELVELEEFHMEDFGFELDFNESEEATVREEDYEEPDSIEHRANVGDLWRLGEHRLICGDSTNLEVVQKLMGGDKADMMFTDPPYGVDYAGKNAFLNAISPGNRIQKDIEGDALENAEAQKNDLWKPALENARECANERCSYYITSPQGGELMMMMMGIKEAGWQLKHCLIWNKNNHVLGRSDYNYKHEPILYGWNKKHIFYGKGERKTSVWDIPKPLKSDLHPTMKPVELIVECLLNSTVAGDNVLDIFGGSGSTLIACEQTGRKCFMCELEPHYVDVIIDRWERLTGKKAVKLCSK